MKKIAAFVFSVSVIAASLSGCGKVEENFQAGTPDSVSIPLITAEVKDPLQTEPAEEDPEVSVTEVSVTTVTEEELAYETAEVTLASAAGTKKSGTEDNRNNSDSSEVNNNNSSQNSAAKPKETEKTAAYETDAPVRTDAPLQTDAPEETEAPPQTDEEAPPEPAYAEPYYYNGVLIVNKSYPVSSDYYPGNMVCDEDGDYLTIETMSAFQEMKADAAAEGLTLWVQSGFRSYETQKRLYNNYAASDGYAAADTYSARPGYSEHQTGLAFDLNTISSSFAYTAEGQWVAENCYKYGFIIRYPQGKESLTGYIYEPWHLRYLGVELATSVYNSGLCLEEYFGLPSYYAD